MRRLSVILFLLCVASLVVAQTPDAQMSNSSYDTQRKDTAAYNPGGGVKQFVPPVFRGMSAHLDIASPLMGQVYGRQIINAEAQVDVNLYDRLFPIVEVGYTSAQKSIGKAHYQTNSPFFKLGINYGLLKGNKDDGTTRSLASYPFIGVRYGFSTMNYRLDNVVVTDDYWGGEQTRDYSKMLVYAGWLEVVGGVRVDLYRGLTMGWSVRLLTAVHSSKNVVRESLWYVPGYGNATSASSFTFNYTIGYTFNTSYFKKQHETVE